MSNNNNNNNIYNIGIEKAVLSSIFFDCIIIEDISTVLKPSDFYLPAHSKVYEAMLSLFDEDLPIDESFVQKRVSSKEVDDSVLIEILSANSITNPIAYALEIKEAATKRELLQVSTQIKKLIIEDETNANDALEHTQIALNYISNNALASGLKTTNEIVDSFHNKFMIASETKENTGVKTGIKRLDNLIGNLEAGKLFIVGARPSMGKTALATTITKNVLESGHGVLFDSLEMGSDDLMERLIANYTDDDTRDLKKGMCKNLDKYNKALHFYKNNNLVLHDMSYPTVRQLRAKASKIFRTNPKIKLWIIDHLRYIKTAIKDRHLEVGNITKELKEIGKKHGVTVMLLAQLNRDVQQKTRNDHRPNLSDLRDSGSIEEDADIVIFPHRPSYYTRTDPAMPEKPVNDAELIVAKNRDGLTGVAKCKFNGPSTKFINDDGFRVTVFENVNDVNNVDIPDI